MTSSALIDEDALVARRIGERVGYVAILDEVGHPPDEQIGGHGGLALYAPDRHRIIEVCRLGAIRHDCQEIPVAVDPSITPNTTPEKPDLKRTPTLDDTRQDRLDR